MTGAADLFEWRPWHPAELHKILMGARFPWHVAGGWALDLWLGHQSRDHHDIEIAVPRINSTDARRIFTASAFALHAVADGHTTPLDAADAVPAGARQLWVSEGTSWRTDIFLEPGDGETWQSHRYPALNASLADIILRTDDGIPFLAPELILLYKAKHQRPKDDLDFATFAPLLGSDQSERLAQWLDVLHPGHQWIGQLTLDR